ncbi:hypothetical protein [Enterococcus faecalis]|uniref:hypothetical protein n=1 Tax=Enterococcus faecalis TaxID=1351 RepID=UPI001A10E2BF|nr:hypothetical protein [Enterococcus faecalis]MDB1567277.1 hypothetical protein [Enterococcus faecalis]MDB1569870.1 hypothetical protein [Enterococcus faecalis]MDB1575411.1 hypothetical protein [Enterococcus faecalis]MDB1650128.1 hypothetical protein [Enterococcus faecalis]MDB1658080.1 hypothetical protein [Enterococcus faecalis]
MFDYIRKDPEQFITIFTVLSALLLNLLGFSDEDVRKKKLRIILLSYTIIFMLVLSAGENVTFFMFLLNVSLFLFGGLIYSANMDQDLEKELNLLQFFIYNSSAWFLLVQNYVILIETIVLFILIPIVRAFNFNSFMTKVILSVFSLIACFIQYFSVIKDYFDLKSFSVVLKELNKNREVTLNMEHPKPDNSNLNILKNNQKKLLSFVLYCEDKNFFESKSNTISFVDLKMKWEKPSIFKDKITLDIESKKRKYFRGYSTIEQQLIRQFSMAPYSYRYTIRRKLFNDWVYTPLFCKAICNRKSRVYGKKKKRIARKELMWNLKYIFLIQYLTIILKTPSNLKELIEEMSKQSRVSVEVYEKMYTIFKDSDEVNYYIEQIEENASRKFNFY